ncbi:MAG: hypothetical protein ACM3U2_11510 [Deltaproteobacteria bacterium]
MIEERKGRRILLVWLAWLGRLIAIATPVTVVFAVIVISTPTGLVGTILFWTVVLCGKA